MVRTAPGARLEPAKSQGPRSPRRSALTTPRVLLETARLDLAPLKALSQALSGRGRS